ncbi:RbsD/FucU family protein [Granulicella sp. L60]|uniref:RbsD/FucU family protein n=1 Tax=Granulicella sp. L60 TaxID=1641866 RepID=UPI00131D4C2C|nr:RbsD/FucU domain-containing protein [Granulicella sp. L60]
MLKGISPLLSPEILHILSSMGHRHELAIVDANFACDGSGPRVTRLDGISATALLDAVLSVFPLERKDAQVCWRMVANGNPEDETPIFKEFREIISKREGADLELFPLASADFKERASKAYAVIVTGERRPYGNVIVRKGVVLAE